MSAKKTSFAFEQSLNALQATVEQLESGDLSLEEALQAFEKGIALSRECQGALNQAQTRINVLLEQNGTLVEQPLEAASSEANPAPDADDPDEIPF